MFCFTDSSNLSVFDISDQFRLKLSSVDQVNIVSKLSFVRVDIFTQVSVALDDLVMVFNISSGVLDQISVSDFILYGRLDSLFTTNLVFVLSRLTLHVLLNIRDGMFAIHVSSLDDQLKNFIYQV